jgi:hypothetical protein
VNETAAERIARLEAELVCMRADLADAKAIALAATLKSERAIAALISGLFSALLAALVVALTKWLH